MQYYDVHHVRRSLYGKDPDQLMARLRVITAERDKGTPTHRTRMTLATWLDTWLERYAAKPRTQLRYRNALDRRWGWHTQLMRTQLTQVTPEALQNVLARQLELGHPAASRVYGLKVMRAALQVAVVQGKLGQNPARLVMAPDHRPAPMVALHPDEQARLRPILEAHPLAAAWALALDMGLRIGELLGLDWTDVDLTHGQLAVRRTAHDDGTTGTTKSHRSDRPLMMMPSVQAALEARWELLGRPTTGPVFLAPATGRGARGLARLGGERMRSRALREQWTQALAQAGVRPVRFHSTRVTMITDQDQAGTPLTHVQDYVGHSSLDMTRQYVKVRARQLPALRVVS